MKLKQSQYGVTMVSLAFNLGLLAFVVFTALKLFPVYMEAFTVESSVESLETDKSREYNSPMQVRSGIIKRFAINNVSLVEVDDVVVVREDQLYIVDVDYDVRIPYIGNIDLVIKFENHAEVAVPAL